VVDSGQVGSVPWPTGVAGGPMRSAGEPRPDRVPSSLAELPELADEACLAEEAADAADGACPAELSELAVEPCLTAGTGEPSACRARGILQRVGDKWSAYVIDLLGQDTKRFTELHRSIDGITARMLTVTLRGLERDGIVTRTIHPVIPPRVDYALTPLGRTLLDTIGQLVSWADSHVTEIEAARAAYDAKHAPQ
jgi:DNA-binding HxlR family transcriptional regulator